MNIDNKNKYTLPQFALYKLTKLLIKQEFEDRKKGKSTYVKKTQAYKDLIKLIKEVWNEEIRQ